MTDMKHYCRKAKILISDEKGIALIMTLIILLVVTAMGSFAINVSKVEGWLSSNYKTSRQAFYTAEAGLELMKAYLNNDAGSDSSHSWANGNFVFPSPTGTLIATNSSSYYSITLPDSVRTISLGSVSGTFTIRLRNIGSPSYSADRIIVESTGTAGGATAVAEANFFMKDNSTWNNSVFGGAGGFEGSIRGNANIAGSVHILGTGLSPTDYAVNMSGGALLSNNYNGMDAALKALIPSIGSPEDLQSELRIKHGKVGLSGSATIGQPESTSANKDTVQGVYVTDGYGGTNGASAVYSDNGTGNAYDLSNDLTFPSLSNPYTDPDTGTPYATYSAYLTAKSYVYSGNLDISSNTASFTIGNANGSITWNQAANTLTISGLVKVVGDIDIAKKGSPLTYTGRGTLYSTNDIKIHDNTLPSSGFPATNALGLIATRNLELSKGAGESQLLTAGSFYAGNQIASEHQNQIAGAFVSNYVDLGTGSPSIYQVPSLSRNLPPYMPGSTTSSSSSSSNYSIQVRSWRIK